MEDTKNEAVLGKSPRLDYSVQRSGPVQTHPWQIVFGGHGRLVDKDENGELHKSRQKVDGERIWREKKSSTFLCQGTVEKYRRSNTE